MTAWVALLRGVNVGGVTIRNADLAALMTDDLGFADVRTVLASGNVTFEADAAPSARARLKKSIADVDVPEVPEFLEQIVASGGHLWACRMSADMNHLTMDDLYDGVEAIISATDFIDMTDGAQLLFI